MCGPIFICDKNNMASLEEGELEDGELLSSDEEEQGDRDGPEKVCNSYSSLLITY